MSDMLRDYGDWAGVLEAEMERNGGIQDIGWSKPNRINTWRKMDDSGRHFCLFFFFYLNISINAGNI